MQNRGGRGSYCKPATIPSAPRACPPWQVSQFTTKKKRSDLVGAPLLVQGVGENLRLLLGILRPRVLLLLVNILRRLVLFVVDLFLFSGRQLAAVGLAVRGDLLVDALLLLLELCRFAGCQFPALDPLRDAILLVFAALIHFVVAVVRRIGVVLVFVNLFLEVVLLLV